MKKPYRARVQRSTKLLAIIKSRDSMANLTARVRIDEFVNIAEQLGRHALALKEEGGK